MTPDEGRWCGLPPGDGRTSSNDAGCVCRSLVAASQPPLCGSGNSPRGQSRTARRIVRTRLELRRSSRRPGDAPLGGRSASRYPAPSACELPCVFGGTRRALAPFRLPPPEPAPYAGRSACARDACPQMRSPFWGTSERSGICARGSRSAGVRSKSTALRDGVGGSQKGTLHVG